jgi:hypothetical protein
VIGDSPLALRRIIHQRRSAVALDGHTGLPHDAFYRILLKVMPGSRQVPFTTLPWRPCVDLLLFVHRVADLTPGLYALLRDPARKEALEGSMDRAFAWTRPAGCPGSLPLFFLEEGDARRAAQQTSCDQRIAADGVFAAAMLTEYRASLEALGPWFYRRLYWETGVIGQVLYLEAEASGIRSTGIGCFFDDLTHRVFGLTGDRFQVLYHFTMGGPVDDPRLQTHPPYQHLARDNGRDARSGTVDHQRVGIPARSRTAATRHADAPSLGRIALVPARDGVDGRPARAETGVPWIVQRGALR